MNEENKLSQSQLEMLAAVRQSMPFGKYSGKPLLDLPEYYLVWFKQRGFPAGKLGAQMALVYEIKLNGLEKVFRPLLDLPSTPPPTESDELAGDDTPKGT